jgi:hypothetical protein
MPQWFSRLAIAVRGALELPSNQLFAGAKLAGMSARARPLGYRRPTRNEIKGAAMAGHANAGASTGSNDVDGGVKEQAQDKAQEVREQAGEQMRKAGGEARNRVRDQVDQRSTDAGEQVHRHAGDLRDVAQQLREQGKDAPARVADQVAERAERAGSWMKESDADRIIGDVEDFARSNPWAVAAGGLALGFAASRVLKASSSRRYEERDAARRLPPAGGTTASGPVGTTVVDEPRTIPANPRPPVPASAPSTDPAIDDSLRAPARRGGL